MNPNIAEAQEVLEMMTAVMRGENGDEKWSERYKEAEDLAKHYGLFDKKDEKNTRNLPERVAEIQQALQEVKDAYTGSNPPDADTSGADWPMVRV